MKSAVLVIEDDRVLNQLLVRALTKFGYDVSFAYSWTEARRRLDEDAPDAVLLDMGLPDAQGFDPLAEIAQTRPTVVLTAFGSIDHAVRAMRLGAADYLVKPVNLDELELVLRRVVDSNRMRAGVALDVARQGAQSRLGMLGRSPAMKRLWELIDAVADSDITALVTGESGVGKELVAQAIHAASSRSKERFVTVDCCTLQETLFESELFGHERGAFTGADRRKPGLIEAAAGGTLFLDEIGDISPVIQAKLLRVLETGRFRRLGATTDLRADVRIVTATNRDLSTMIRSGHFRQDLYFRLSAFMITVPTLRDRREDIPDLVRHFAGAPGRPAVRFSPETMERLCLYDWPGNVRELRNVVERAVLLASRGAGEVLPSHLPTLRVPESDPVTAVQSLALGAEPTLEEIENNYLAQLLKAHGGNRQIVAQIMGVSERTTYRMIQRLKSQDPDAAPPL